MPVAGRDLALPSDPEPEQQLIGGNEQEGRPGEPLPVELVVRLVDGGDRGLPDRAVSWSCPRAIEPLAEGTDEEGYARAEWTLGPGIRVHTVDAVVSHV